MKDDFAEFYANHYSPTLHYVYTLLGDFHAAEDVTQQVFADVVKRNPPVPLRTLAFEFAAKYQRKRRDEPTAEPIVTTIVADSHDDDMLTAFMNSVADEIDRQILNMILVNHQSRKQVATALNVTRSAVDQRLRKYRDSARNFLRK